MANQRYLHEVAQAKELMRKKIDSYITIFFSEREKAYAVDNESMEGLDYWNEELGLDTDEMANDFIRYLEEGF